MFWVIVVVVAMLGLVLSASLFSMREKQRRATCLNNLKQIGLSLRLYSEIYPCDPQMTTLGSLALMTNNYQTSYKTWICPSDIGVTIGSPTQPFTSKNLSYAYNGFGLSENVEPDTPLLADRTSADIRSSTPWANNVWTHKTDGGNVLFDDDHVAFMKTLPVPMYRGKNP
jgi:hypothetical protein